MSKINQNSVNPKKNIKGIPKNHFSDIEWLRKGTFAILTWNLLVIAIVLLKNFQLNTLKFWNINFGDYARTDLGYLIASSTFDTPYKFHPELPNITVTNYLPLPFMFLKLLGIKFVEDWNRNAFNIIGFAIISVILMALIIYFSMARYNMRDRVLFSTTYGVLSVPSLYLFSTANIQGVLTFIIFLGFAPIMFRNQKKSRKWFPKMRLISFAIVGAAKPQYLAWNILSFFKDSKIKYRELIVGFILTSSISILGFTFFSGGFESNFSYFIKSLFSFTTPDPAYIVHFNDSLIGNLLGMELLFFPNNILSSILLNYEKLFLLTYIACSLTLFYLLIKHKSPLWLKLWLFGGLSISAVPVSYAYSFTAYLIPLGLLLNDFSLNEQDTKSIFKSRSNKILLVLCLFLAFSPKLGYLMLVDGVADSRVYSLFSSFSHVVILVLSINFIKLKKKVRSL